MACPIINRIKRKTDSPIRQDSDLTILPEVSPLIMLKSAENRLIMISKSINSTMYLYIGDINISFVKTYS